MMPKHKDSSSNLLKVHILGVGARCAANQSLLRVILWASKDWVLARAMMPKKRDSNSKLLKVHMFGVGALGTSPCNDVETQR